MTVEHGKGTAGADKLSDRGLTNRTATANPLRPDGTEIASAGLGEFDVAIVHDYLNQRGGAERVVLELAEMWPDAPIYTSLYRPESTLPGFKNRDIRTSVLDRLPVDQSFRSLFPLYPSAFRLLGEIDADIVLASSSGWAHMVRSTARAFRVVYCYTPARWLYGGRHLQRGESRSIGQFAATPALGLFRRMDRQAALRADLYIAISENVQRKIRSAYGIDSVVVPPPVDLGRFRPTPRGDRLLCVSRLLPYKHVDLVVRAATRAGLGLDVVGDGPMLTDLRRIAGPTVELHGAVNDDVVVGLMESCRAVCVAAEEDFGLVAVEAQAAGKPVIAYGRGGSLETIERDVTGSLFTDRTEDCFLAAVAASDQISTSPEEIAHYAQQFSSEAFRSRLTSTIGDALASGGHLRMASP